MKILFVLNQNEIGGAEKFVFDLCSYFHLEGYDVSIFFLKQGNYEFFNEDTCFKKKILFGNKNSLYNPLAIFKLILLSRKFDIIHVNLFPSFYLAIFIKIFSKVKLIYTEHSTYNRRRDIPILKNIDRLLYNIYDSIICINTDVKNSLIKHLGFNFNISTIENGINLDFIRNAPRININKIIPTIKESDFVLCQVSSFIEPKDQMTIVQAMRYLPKNVKLILVGDGIKRRNVENFVESNNLKHRVFFLGIRNDAISIIKSSDLCVLSSGYEGLSIFCLESFACEVPIIGSNVPGLRDLLDSNSLFDYKSQLSFSDLVTKILEDSNFRADLINIGSFKIKSYSMDICFEKHALLYKKILL